MGYSAESLQITEKMAKRVLRMPFHNNMTSDCVQRVCALIKDYFMENNYIKDLANYREFHDSIDINCDQSRLEFQFESLKDRSVIGSIDDLCSWFKTQQSIVK